MASDTTTARLDADVAEVAFASLTEALDDDCSDFWADLETVLETAVENRQANEFEPSDATNALALLLDASRQHWNNWGVPTA